LQPGGGYGCSRPEPRPTAALLGGHWRYPRPPPRPRNFPTVLSRLLGRIPGSPPPATTAPGSTRGSARGASRRPGERRGSPGASRRLPGPRASPRPPHSHLLGHVRLPELLLHHGGGSGARRGFQRGCTPHHRAPTRSAAQSGSGLPSQRPLPGHG